MSIWRPLIAIAAHGHKHKAHWACYDTHHKYY